MAKQKHLRFRKGDFLAIAAVLLLAAFVGLCFLPDANSDETVVRIYQNGELIHTLSLEEEGTVTVTGDYTNRITVEDGAVAITTSDCPGEDCVHSGAIRTPGRSLVCLPNGVEVRIVGTSGDVDFVVG